jgi:hypothetical protein
MGGLNALGKTKPLTWDLKSQEFPILFSDKPQREKSLVQGAVDMAGFMANSSNKHPPVCLQVL